MASHTSIGGAAQGFVSLNRGRAARRAARRRCARRFRRHLSFTAKNVKIITAGGKVTLRGPVISSTSEASVPRAAAVSRVGRVGREELGIDSGYRDVVLDVGAWFVVARRQPCCSPLVEVWLPSVTQPALIGDRAGFGLGSG
jgi:hypothetical protein